MYIKCIKQNENNEKTKEWTNSERTNDITRSWLPTFLYFIDKILNPKPRFGYSPREIFASDFTCKVFYFKTETKSTIGQDVCKSLKHKNNSRCPKTPV